MEVKNVIKEVYKEICTKITENIPEVKWIDLWHNQVSFLDQEHQFPAPAVFLAFRIISVMDTGNKGQKLVIQVDMYLFYETFADTYNGSWNQDDALDFLDNIGNLHRVFHGSAGATYSNMRRIGMSSVDTGTAQNLYLQPFSCEVIDYGASKEYDTADIEDIEITQAAPAPEEPEEPEPPYFIH